MSSQVVDFQFFFQAMCLSLTSGVLFEHPSSFGIHIVSILIKLLQSKSLPVNEGKPQDSGSKRDQAYRQPALFSLNDGEDVTSQIAASVVESWSPTRFAAIIDHEQRAIASSLAPVSRPPREMLPLKRWSLPTPSSHSRWSACSERAPPSFLTSSPRTSPSKRYSPHSHAVSSRR